MTCIPHISFAKQLDYRVQRRLALASIGKPPPAISSLAQQRA
jgi:hypothetical protein